VTRAKICGITRLEDAELAAELGAWALGFILWPGSSRACDPAVAAGIARHVRRKIEVAGVFVNPTLGEVAQAVDLLGLSLVQLHGEEGPSFCAEVARRTGARVIKAVRVHSGADVRDLARFRNVDFHLLDTGVEGVRGGTGQTWDWALAATRRSPAPLILSGGLTPENVAEGIARVKPYAVDVASGVEASPGVKDPERLAAFLAAVAGTSPALYAGEAEAGAEGDPLPLADPEAAAASPDALAAEDARPAGDDGVPSAGDDGAPAAGDPPPAA
jgi:phosphoribosylanthranilate isomerase